MPRPTLYDEEKAERLCDLVATGDYNIEDICKQVGIHTQTYYVWQRAHPEFAAAIKESRKRRLEAFTAMAKSGLAKILDVHTVEETTTEYLPDETGKPQVRSQKITKKTFMPNAAAIIFTLKNRESEHWSDKQQHEHSGSVNLSAWENLSNIELQARKKELEEFLESGDDL